jgi:hypothetical protein
MINGNDIGHIYSIRYTVRLHRMHPYTRQIYYGMKRLEILDRGPCPYCGKKTLYFNGWTTHWKTTKRYRCRMCLNSCTEKDLKPEFNIPSLPGRSWRKPDGESFQEFLEEEAYFLEVEQFQDNRPEGLKKWMHEHGRR